MQKTELSNLSQVGNFQDAHWTSTNLPQSVQSYSDFKINKYLLINNDLEAKTPLQANFRYFSR